MNLFKSVGIGIGFGLGLAACGGSGTTEATAPGSRSASQALAPQQGAPAMAIAMGASGARVDVTADWTVSGNDVNVYVAQGDCFDIPSALSVWSCINVAQATGNTSKPERLSFSAEPSQTYRIFVVNQGSAADTVTVTADLH